MKTAFSSFVVKYAPTKQFVMLSVHVPPPHLPCLVGSICLLNTEKKFDATIFEIYY